MRWWRSRSEAAYPEEATCTWVVAYTAEHQRATPLNHNPCHVVQGSTWHHSYQRTALQNTPTWHLHVPNVQSDGHHLSRGCVMPGSSRHLALDTFPDSTHAKDRPAERTFHVATIPRTAHLPAAATQCHYLVTESRGLLLPSGTPDTGFAGLHRLPAALTLENQGLRQLSRRAGLDRVHGTLRHQETKEDCNETGGLERWP